MGSTIVICIHRVFWEHWEDLGTGLLGLAYEIAWIYGINKSCMSWVGVNVFVIEIDLLSDGQFADTLEK